MLVFPGGSSSRTAFACRQSAMPLCVMGGSRTGRRRSQLALCAQLQQRFRWPRASGHTRLIDRRNLHQLLRSWHRGRNGQNRNVGPAYRLSLMSRIFRFFTPCAVRDQRPGTGEGKRRNGNLGRVIRNAGTGRWRGRGLWTCSALRRCYRGFLKRFLLCMDAWIYRPLQRWRSGI
jgi:hypothetical protein